ncbi:hypothetical protein P3S68_031861 [Capsicum galapagoense]
MSNKLAFFFGILLVTLTVNSFWSSNIQVMALRDIPFEVQVIEDIVLPNLANKKGCYKLCSSDANCNNRVDSFWSSNIKVMALRDLPLLEKVQVIKQMVLQDEI